MIKPRAEESVGSLDQSAGAAVLHACGPAQRAAHQRRIGPEQPDPPVETDGIPQKRHRVGLVLPRAPGIMHDLAQEFHDQPLFARQGGGQGRRPRARGAVGTRAMAARCGWHTPA